MSLKPIDEWEKPFFSERIHACPRRTHSTSFQLVDERGDGRPYAGLAYEVIDAEEVVYLGVLDETGTGKIHRHYCGPVRLKLDKSYQGGDELYKDLRNRPHYPLPITELQVRAEKTRFINPDGARTRSNPAQGQADSFCQVEVSELVEHRAHLPPLALRHFPPQHQLHALMRRPAETAAMAELGFGPRPPRLRGIALLPNRHHVLEVRPLRALSPLLSTDEAFCYLNLYQLALMSTLSYSPFGQVPDTQPVETDSVSFPAQPSVGNWFGDALARSDELWQVDATQAGGKAYYPLYEEVAYSRRLELVPFDPELYPEVNSPELGADQEHPARLHYLDDSDTRGGTDTQAYVTHNDELILLVVRGTAGMADVLRDVDAAQTPFEGTSGKVHNGFYESAKVAIDFFTAYLDKFYSGQKLVITGHSLGGGGGFAGRRDVAAKTRTIRHRALYLWQPARRRQDLRGKRQPSGTSPHSQPERSGAQCPGDLDENVLEPVGGGSLAHALQPCNREGGAPPQPRQHHRRALHAPRQTASFHARVVCRWAQVRDPVDARLRKHYRARRRGGLCQGTGRKEWLAGARWVVAADAG